MKYSSERGQERDRLTARIKELEQRDQENCGIMVMSGMQVEWYARKLSESQQQLAAAPDMLAALDLAWSVADAIAEGRHSADVVKWDSIRDTLQAALDAARKEP